MNSTKCKKRYVIIYFEGRVRKIDSGISVINE